MDPRTPLIEVDELAQMTPESCLLVDCRFELDDPDAGERDYLHEHIPGAVYADLDRDLSDRRAQNKNLGRHPLPAPHAFARTLGRWGWRDGMTVIAYDAGTGAMAAARLWWLVRWMGAPARVLDGGLAAWRAADQPVESGPVTREPTHVEVSFDAAQVVFTPVLKQLLADDEITLIDARAAARYRGESEPIDPAAGHIPGARNHPFTTNVADGPRWRSADEVRAEFARLIGDRDPTEVVHMCGSGVTACHNLLAMEHAGLRGSRLYAPSWSGWSSDTGNPVATGD
jgi:thiosulfate/3-mercaptopyruvate sulfurtransferase